MPRRKKAESGPTTLIESPVGNDYMKRRTMPSTLGDWMFSSYTMQEPHCNEPEVSQHSVLSIAPFFRAVSILCSLPARIPVILKRRVANNKSELANNDERYFMAKKKPNGLLRARTWKKTMMLHVQIAPGGGFSEIIRDPDTGFPLAIVPLDPNRMAWGILEENRLSKMVYLYSERVGVPARHILPNDILHFKGLSYDTIMGMDTVELHKEEFSLTLARRQYAGKYFIDNCHLRGFLMIPSGIDLNLFANMMTTIGAHMREQAKNPLKAVPLFDGVQWQPTQDNPQSSQLQESMKMTPAQASQLTGVPEFFLGGEHKGSYNALENILQGFFITTVDDHFDELESEMDDKLLTEDELRKEELFFQFDRRRLHAMNVAAFRKMLRDDFHSGLISWEEARDALGDSVDLGEDGTFFMPQNIIGAEPTQMGSNGKPTSKPKKKSNDKPAEPNNSIQKISVANLAVQTIGRLCDRIQKSAINATKKAERFEQWLQGLRGRESQIVNDNLTPVVNIAMSMGMITADPKYDLLGLYTDKIYERLNAAGAFSQDSFVQLVTACCDEIKLEACRAFPNFLTGVE